MRESKLKESNFNHSIFNKDDESSSLKAQLEEANEKVVVLTNTVDELKEKELILTKEIERENNEVKE